MFQLVKHLSTPLYRNGYALVMSATITSGFGVLYWVLAARQYSTDDVGLNSAIISSMIFLANISQLNLMNALNRFVPIAGRATARFLTYSYLISLAVAFVTGMVFLLGIDLWTPKLGHFADDPYFVIWFVLSTMLWCIFVLQDSALVGLQKATIVPVENTFFALSKLALLVGFAGLIPTIGIFVSWTLPLILLVVAINYIIFRSLIPQHVRMNEDKAVLLIPMDIARYVAGNYLASLAWMATINLLPLVVLQVAGATANAYFYLSWTIAYSLYLVSRNMGMSLITEAAINPAMLPAYSYRICVQTARILIPGTAVIVIAAPYVLLLFGEDYAAEATHVLRLLCLSAIPNIITSTYVSIVRVQNRVKAIVLTLTSLCGLVLILTYALLPEYGIVGVGWAWLISQTIIAIILLATELRTMWLSQINIRPIVKLLVVPHRMWWRWSHRHQIKQAYEAIPAILTTISPSPDYPVPTEWNLQRVIPTVSDMTVISLGVEGNAAIAMLKMPQTDLAATSLQRQIDVLAALHGDSRLGEWRSMLPTLMAEGENLGKPYVVERVLPGCEVRQLFSGPRAWANVQNTVIMSIQELHRRTMTRISVTPEQLALWVDEPLGHLRRLVETGFIANDTETILEKLQTELWQVLEGRNVAVSWIHGDFVPENILMSADGQQVTGIIDWELAQEQHLPQLDLIMFFFSARLQMESKELGLIVRELLGKDSWGDDEEKLLNAEREMLSGDDIDMRILVLLCWLKHVSSTLARSTRYAKHRLWISQNIEAVLKCL